MTNTSLREAPPTAGNFWRRTRVHGSCPSLRDATANDFIQEPHSRTQVRPALKGSTSDQ